ncbi:rRNA-processing protein bfr2 [Balamuthia mandrillaris]
MPLSRTLAQLFDPSPKATHGEEEGFLGEGAKLASADYFSDSINEDDSQVRKGGERLPLRPALSLGPKYEGKATSRQILADAEGYTIPRSSSEEEFSEESDLRYPHDLSSDDDQPENDLDEEEEEDDSGSEEEQEQQVSTRTDANLNSLFDRSAEDVEKELEELEREQQRATVAALSGDNTKEMEKATHAMNQLILWNAFLDLRIRLQKALGMASRMPQHDSYALFLQQDQQIGRNINELDSAIVGLLGELTNLEQVLFSQSETFKAASEGSNAAKRKREDDNGDQDELEATWLRIKGLTEVMYPKVNDVVQKWSDKTQITSGGALLNKNLKAIGGNAIRQIEQVLKDEDRLVKRTQLRRSSYSVFAKDLLQEEDGPPQEELFDDEIFDDSDFYNKLLREFIESSSADAMDPDSIGRNYVKAQKLQAKKKKRVVDQRASKGRKIRYDVQGALVNFMPPIPDTKPWPVAEELFQNLFH